MRKPLEAYGGDFACAGGGRVNNGRSKLAVFFDAENVSLQHAPAILQMLSADWDVHLRRAYGWNVSALEEILRELSIIPVEVLRNTNFKNGADLTLAVDAMEELCLGSSDGICIVSGDSDFTRLVQRIRERGKDAIAFGGANTPASLRNACTKFYLLAAHDEAQKTIQKTDSKPKPPAKSAPSAKPKQPAKSPSSAKKKAESPKGSVAQQGIDPGAAASLRKELQRAFQEFGAVSGSDSLTQFGQFIHKSYPQLRPQKFGFARLRVLLARAGGFRVEPQHGGGGVVSDYRVWLVKDGAGGAVKHPRV
jgi:uncharacterized LabA/DUF88 family protein